jgi:hypothetical protein
MKLELRNTLSYRKSCYNIFVTTLLQKVNYYFKKFWPQMRDIVMEMLVNLHEGSLDLWRLNYGVFILLPKVKPATHIRQFRPIWLLNVFYKIITKIRTVRLIEVINRVVSPCQTTFVPGRNILEGVVILLELLHELKVKKNQLELFWSWTLEKLMIMWVGNF